MARLPRPGVSVARLGSALHSRQPGPTPIAGSPIHHARSTRLPIAAPPFSISPGNCRCHLMTTHSTQTALKFEQLPTFPHLMPSAVQHCPPDARLVKNHSQYATRLPRSCFVRYHATHHSGPCRTLRLSKPAAEFQHYEAFRKSVTM